MTLLFYVLLSVGLVGVVDPVVFRFKYAKAVYIAVGVICLAAAVRI